jgi:hypothetical protein
MGWHGPLAAGLFQAAMRAFGMVTLRSCGARSKKACSNACLFIKDWSLIPAVVVLPSKDAKALSLEARSHSACSAIDVRNRDIRPLLPPLGPPLRRHHGDAKMHRVTPCGGCA